MTLRVQGPVVVTDDGEREIFTDENGQAVTCKIPYGTYIVTESTVPKGFEKAAEFTVEVKENSDTPQAWLNVINTSQKQRVRITKKDDDTGASVLKAGPHFRCMMWNGRAMCARRSPILEGRRLKSLPRMKQAR